MSDILDQMLKELARRPANDRDSSYSKHTDLNREGVVEHVGRPHDPDAELANRRSIQLRNGTVTTVRLKD